MLNVVHYFIRFMQHNLVRDSNKYLLLRRTRPACPIFHKNLYNNNIQTQYQVTVCSLCQSLLVIIANTVSRSTNKARTCV